MAFEINYHADEDCIFVSFSGRISMPIVRKYLELLLPILEETGCTRLLSDCLDAEINLTSTDIMQFPKLAAASPLTARLKRAVVAAPGTSGFELYEALSRIMGQRLKVFRSREAALEWLMADSK